MMKCAWEQVVSDRLELSCADQELECSAANTLGLAPIQTVFFLLARIVRSVNF